MIKLKNKTDIVRVIAGDHKGSEGKVYVLTVRKQSDC
jgi:ribosomal protein L24